MIPGGMKDPQLLERMVAGSDGRRHSAPQLADWGCWRLLTVAQRRVCVLISQGFTQHEIGRATGVSERAVYQMLRRIKAVIGPHAPLRGPLSRREREVMFYVSHGFGESEVARFMGCAKGTVQEFKRRIRLRGGPVGVAAITRYVLAHPPLFREFTLPKRRLCLNGSSP